MVGNALHVGNNLTDDCHDVTRDGSGTVVKSYSSAVPASFHHVLAYLPPGGVQCDPMPH